MSFTTSAHLGLQEPSDGETSWGDEGRANLETIDDINAPHDTYFVSPKFTSSVLANTPSDRRHFDTLQAAITSVELNGESGRYTIFVYPGNYAEDLSITKSMNIVSAVGKSYIGASPVSITGTGNNPIIDWQPIASTVCNLQFSGIRMESANPNQGGTTVTDPLFIHVQDQSAYGGYKNVLLLDDCLLRHNANSNPADTYTYGIRATGKNLVAICGSTIITPYHALGGDSDVTYPIYVEGDFGDGEVAAFHAENSLFYNDGLYGDTITLANGCDGSVVRCRSPRPNIDLVRNFAGSGTNSCNGMTDDNEWDAYGNLFNCGDIMTLD